MIKDSGVRQEFSSGAVRDVQQGKGRFDLIPFWPMFAYAAVLEAGAKKYSDRNWQKGMPISRYTDSALRHLLKFQNGERDEPHLWMALWNCAGAIHTQILTHLGQYPAEFDDTKDSVGQPISAMTDFEIKAVDVVLNRGVNRLLETQGEKI